MASRSGGRGWVERKRERERAECCRPSKRIVSGCHCDSRIRDLLWKYVRAGIVKGVVYD